MKNEIMLESEFNPTLKIENMSYYIHNTIHDISDDQRDCLRTDLYEISTGTNKIAILFHTFSIYGIIDNYAENSNYGVRVRRFRKETLDGNSKAEWDKSKTLFEFSKTKKNYDFIER